MTPDAVLDTIEHMLTNSYSGLADYNVVRVPEGVIVLGRDGNHVLVRADEAQLEVVG